MVAQESSGKGLRIVKIFHIVYLVVILMIADLLYGWAEIRDISKDINLNTPTLQIITIAVTLWRIISLIYVCLIPKLLTGTKKAKSLSMKRRKLPFNLNISSAVGSAFTIQIVRVAMFAGVAIFGLVLGILGDGWQITLPFFAVSAIALVLTFPTQKRWNQLLGKFP